MLILPLLRSYDILIYILIIYIHIYESYELCIYAHHLFYLFIMTNQVNQYTFAYDNIIRVYK